MKYKCFAFVFIIALALSGLLSFSAQDEDSGFRYKTIYDSTFVTGDIIHFPIVVFDLGKCTLAADKDSMLNQTDSLSRVVKFINEHPNLVFVVRNHADTVIHSASWKPTWCRSKSIVDRLVALGADSKRISSQGMGDSEPLKLDRTLYLPSGDSLTAGAVLTHRFIATKKSNKADWELLRRLNRRSDLKVVRTDYSPPIDTSGQSQE